MWLKEIKPKVSYASHNVLIRHCCLFVCLFVCMFVIGGAYQRAPLETRPKEEGERNPRPQEKSVSACLSLSVRLELYK